MRAARRPRWPSPGASARGATPSPAPAATHERTQVDDEGGPDEEPLEAAHVVARVPHPREGQRGPRQDEEADERDEPRVEGAAEDIREQPRQDQREPRRDEREEEEEAADAPMLSLQGALVHLGG